MRVVEGFLFAKDGTKLFTRQWEPSDPKAMCLLVHGLGEHSGRYKGLAEQLSSQGFCVWAFDYRGHGRSQGRRGDCSSLDQFVEDLHRVVERSEREHPNLARFLIGHSLGGLLALMVAVRYPQSIRALAVSSPSLKLAREPSWIKWNLALLLARFFPSVPIPNEIQPEQLCRDAQVVQAYVSDPLVFRTVTARCGVALRQTIQGSMQLAKELRLPCLILQAGSDTVCDPNAGERFSKAATQATVTFRRYDGLYHELFNEPERGRVIQDLIHWMDKVLQS